MSLLLSLSLSAGSSLASALVTRGYLKGRHKDELDAFDSQVTGEIEASLRLYGSLKERMNSIFDALDEKEQRYERRLENQRASISSLRETIEEYSNNEQAEDGDPLLRSFQRREKELEDMRELHAELAATSAQQARLLEQAVAGFQPSEDELRTQEELVGTWRDRLDQAESQAEQSIAKLEQKVGALEPQAEQLEQREQELADARAELDALRIQAKTDTTAADEKYSGLEGEAKLLGERLMKLRGESEGAADVITKLERDFKAKKAEAVNADCRAEDAEAKVLLLEENLDHARSAFEARVESSTEECADLQGKLDALASEQDALEQKAQASSAQASEFEQLTEDLEAQLHVAENSYESAHAKAIGFESDIGEKSKELSSVRSDLDKAKQAFEEMSADHSESQAQVEKYEAQIQEQQDAQGAAAKSFEDQLADQTTAAEEAQSKLEERYAELEAKFEEAEGQAQERAAELTQKDADRDELQQALEDVEAAKSLLATDLESATKASSEQTERIESLESSLVLASGEADDQRQAVLDKMSTFQEAQKMLEAMRPMLEGLESTLSDNNKE